MSAQSDKLAFPEARVLVVDDDEAVRSSLTRALNLMGYQADEAASGPQALDLLENTPYDVAVVDIVMAEMDGIELMHWARQKRPGLPIILLTAYADVENAIAGVKLHADDYLRKPVSLQEVAQSIALVLQRRALLSPPPAVQKDRFLVVGPVVLDPDKQTALVTMGDDPIHARLTNAETKLLACLMKHAGVSLSCTDLTIAMGYEGVADKEARSLVRPHISRLRRKIEPDRQRFQLIVGGPDGGYAFNPGPSRYPPAGSEPAGG